MSTNTAWIGQQPYLTPVIKPDVKQPNGIGRVEKPRIKSSDAGTVFRGELKQVLQVFLVLSMADLLATPGN
jgi:hypothetical protein